MSISTTRRTHQWGPWKWCPKSETFEEERKRWANWYPAPRGLYQIRICSSCGRVRVRKDHT